MNGLVLPRSSLDAGARQASAPLSLAMAPAQAAVGVSETGAAQKACSIMACAISRSPMMVVSAPCFCR
jgi:hypothetical protein